MASSRSGYRYRENRRILLERSDVCAICGHGGAKTADHIIPERLWPRDADGKLEPGFHDLGNLQPAHGTAGNVNLNRCPTCGLLCNQVKGHAVDIPEPIHVPEPRSRDW